MLDTKTLRRWPLATAILGLFLLGGCGAEAPNEVAVRKSAPAPQPVALQTLYDQAQQAGEKELVLYTAFPETVELWQAFQRDFPEIRFKPTAITQLYTRLASEVASGNYIGDVVLTGYSELAELVRQQRLVSDAPANSQFIPAAYRDPAGYFQQPWVNVFTMAYNTRHLLPEEVPQSWPQILDERFKKRFAHVRFVGASPFDAAVVILQEEGKLSDAQLQGIHDNGEVSDSPGTLTANLAQGRTDFVLWAPAQMVARLRDDGAPVALTFPSDVAILYGPGVATLHNAPHPHAARLFKTWLFTPRAQAIIAEKEYAYGTMPGSPAPKAFPPIESFVQKSIPFDQVTTYFDRYREKTRAIWR